MLDEIVSQAKPYFLGTKYHPVVGLSRSSRTTKPFDEVVIGDIWCKLFQRLEEVVISEVCKLFQRHVILDDIAIVAFLREIFRRHVILDGVVVGELLSELLWKHVILANAFNFAKLIREKRR